MSMITLRLPNENLIRLRKMAQQNYRNMSDELRKIISEALEKHENGS